MNNPTDEQIGAAVGRKWDKWRRARSGIWDAVDFLDSLIPVDKKWNPRELKLGQQYWIVESSGDVRYTNYGLYPESDAYRLATGNIFPTREAAEQFKADKLKQLD